MTKYIIERFPQPYIDLNEELYHPAHTELATELSKQQADDVDIKLSIVAAHCGYVLDGHYTLQDRVGLCAILVTKLKEKRTGIILHLIGDPQ